MNRDRLVALAPELDWHVAPTTGSTNDDARALALAGAPHGATAVADFQAAGRGRLGRRWVAPPGANVLLSTVLREGLRADRLGLLSLAAAVAVGEVVGPAWRLKWPNDLVDESGRKLAGILAEAEWTDGRPSFVVVGIGINVHAHPPDVPSVCLAGLGAAPERELLTAEVFRGLLRWARRPDGDVLDAWRARSHTLGREVAVAGVTGRAVDLDVDGALILETAAGRTVVRAGDVQAA
jgi:BirA family transcriptional regulator, biotin operon repressor / biotin---[acetyl-CoA-carboxylase] ligase